VIGGRLLALMKRMISAAASTTTCRRGAGSVRHSTTNKAVEASPEKLRARRGNREVPRLNPWTSLLIP
jgi:hypothetical protein